VAEKWPTLLIDALNSQNPRLQLSEQTLENPLKQTGISKIGAHSIAAVSAIMMRAWVGG
jgi:hypothetical protein